ncbi:MAG: phasin family protein [Candidatus Parabeggiatoa sp. nov. 3]|jgi:phasin family protein|nr:MAG: phasin family protein [Gammaproteobacteria bacterium]RKZ66718.1 MAG: phasin family protein [Gammaproteobacteria bacterium]RKZ86034.1 MAG: phasin family protein [Gammaproteobacteria bacterium]
MQNEEMIQQWTEMNQAAMEAIKELGEINTKAMTRLTQRQMDMVNLYMEEGTKQIETLSQAKGAPDIVAAQSRWFTELNGKVMENARQTVEDLVDVKADFTSWAEKGMEKAKVGLSKPESNA